MSYHEFSILDTRSTDFASLFFRYSFQHVVNAGPVSYTTTSIFLIFWSIRKWLENLEWEYPLWIAVAVFIGVWAKINLSLVIAGLAGHF